jgi:hypothetical protein
VNKDDFDIHPVPCVGSGLCCLKARCWIGTRVHGPGDKCPSLVWEDGRYWCGEILKSQDPEQLKRELYVGDGCCMALFNTLRQERLRDMTPEQKDKYRLAVLNFSSPSSDASAKK